MLKHFVVRTSFLIEICIISPSCCSLIDFFSSPILDLALVDDLLTATACYSAAYSSCLSSSNASFCFVRLGKIEEGLAQVLEE